MSISRQRTARRRTALVLSIVAFWLLMMGLLLRRELSFPDRSQGLEANFETRRESWLGIFLADGRRIGHLRLSQAPESRRGLAGGRFGLDARMTLELLGTPTELEIAGAAWRAREAELTELSFEVTTGEHRFDLEGRLEEGRLEAEVRSAGEVFPLSLPLGEAASLGSGFGSPLQLPVLEVGEQARLESFDPLTLQAGQTKVRCVARETLSVAGAEVPTRVLELVSGGLTSRAWIDDGGEVVRAETPFGLVLERITAAEASAAIPAGGGEGLLETLAVEARGERPFRGARRMRLRLAGPSGPEPPADDVQRPLGERRYLVEVGAEPGSPTEPLRGGAERHTDDPHLASDAFVQADHPRIRARAAEIVGDEASPWRRALAIHDWVYHHLEKEAVPSVPSALEVLEARSGDCNEHTVLFAALARAAGVPTRIAVGVVWSEELEGFYYHAWPEVYAGRWLWMDPTLGQPLADATHFKLLEGGIERWPQLLPYLGKLEIEVLEVSAGP